MFSLCWTLMYIIFQTFLTSPSLPPPPLSCLPFAVLILSPFLLCSLFIPILFSFPKIHLKGVGECCKLNFVHLRQQNLASHNDKFTDIHVRLLTKFVGHEAPQSTGARTKVWLSHEAPQSTGARAKVWLSHARGQLCYATLSMPRCDEMELMIEWQTSAVLVVRAGSVARVAVTAVASSHVDTTSISTDTLHCTTLIHVCITHTHTIIIIIIEFFIVA